MQSRVRVRVRVSLVKKEREYRKAEMREALYLERDSFEVREGGEIRVEEVNPREAINLSSLIISKASLQVVGIHLDECSRGGQGECLFAPNHSHKVLSTIEMG